MDVLLAIADDDLREALTFVLEDAGCEVTAMNRRLTVVTGQPWSTPSVIVVLDAHLDEAAMIRLFEAALADGGWRCYRFVILTTLGPEHWPETLARFVRREHAPVLQLPAELGLLVPTLWRLQATQRPTLTSCGADSP
jgi:hypothetical protein